MNTCIAIGELLIDFIPLEKNRALKDVETFSRAAGGAPANVCACVAKLGAPSIMLTKVGEDEFGTYAIEMLKNANVDTSYIKRTKEANTALAFVSLQANGERSFSFYRNPSADLLYNENDIDNNIFKQGNVLHFGSVDLIDSPMKKAHEKAIEIAKKEQMIITFDPNLRFPLWPNIELYHKTIQKFLPEAHILKISTDELAFITGIEDREQAIKSLFKGNTKIILLTDGAIGSNIYTKDKHIFAPSDRVEVQDSTGAGDAFMGAFIYQILKNNLSIDTLNYLVDEKFLLFANKVSAYVVQHKGVIPILPTYKDLLSFYSDNIII